MLWVVLISFLILALTTDRGWAGDVVGQSLIGICVGAMFAEGSKRIICGYYQADLLKIVGGIFPFAGLGLHVYAFAFHVSSAHYILILGAVAFGAIVWLLFLVMALCQALSKAVVDGAAHISHNGG